MELERLAPEFAQRGVAILAASSDEADRAQAMATKVNAQRVRFGYGLGLANARQWGLYISTSRGTTSIGIEEPALFSASACFSPSPPPASPR